MAGVTSYPSCSQRFVGVYQNDQSRISSRRTRACHEHEAVLTGIRGQGSLHVVKCALTCSLTDPQCPRQRSRILCCALSSGEAQEKAKVVGLGGVGLDYLAQVAAFPKPDEKLRTEKMEVNLQLVPPKRSVPKTYRHGTSMHEQNCVGCHEE